MDYTLFILTFVSVSLLPGLCMSLAFSLGLSLGYKNTLWMIFGELVGLALVVLCCALGIEFILRYENLFKFFQIAGALYLLYIAFILFKSKSQITQEKIIHKKKFSLIIQGFIASSSNPKAWIFMFSILPSFLKFQVNVNILLLIILLIEFCSLSLYALGGSIFKIFMNKHLDKINKISALFIFAMALLAYYIKFNLKCFLLKLKKILGKIMKNTVTEASIYEAQGLKDEALEIYKNILKEDPNNQNAIDAVRRLSGFRSKHQDLNTQMLDFFINMKSDEEINEFKRWLIKI